MGLSKEKQQAFLNDPTDMRHGTNRGYQLKCRCERCLDAGRSYGRVAAEKSKQRKMAKYRKENEAHKAQLRAREAAARKRGLESKARKAAKGNSDTVLDEWKPLMGRESVLNERRCVVCHEDRETAPYQIVPDGAGAAFVGGIEVRKPKLSLCPDCAKAATDGLLHFRWVDTDSTRKGAKLPNMEFVMVIKGGHYERAFSEGPMERAEAMSSELDWRRI